MKTKEKELEKLSQAMIRDTLAYKLEELQTVQQEMSDVYTYGQDPATGVLTEHSVRRIRQLQKEEKNILKKIAELELQLEVYTQEKPSDFDLIRTFDLYDKEQQEYQKSLQEIQQARQKGHSKEQEIER